MPASCPSGYRARLQQGFTTGIADLQLTEAADAQRTALLSRADGVGLGAAAKFAERPDLGAKLSDGGDGNGARAALRSVLRDKLVGDGDKAGGALDAALKHALMPLASEVTMPPGHHRMTTGPLPDDHAMTAGSPSACHPMPIATTR